MHLLIDADSSMYKAGMSNEERGYIVLNADGYVVHECKYKKEATLWVEGSKEEGATIESTRKAGPLSHSLSNLKLMCHAMTAISHETRQIYIGGKGNFRYDIYPEYKANRRDGDKPIHMKEMEEYLMAHWGAIKVDGEEVDDRVAWEQCTSKEETCIVSIDKDLLGVPGWNYNYDKKTLRNITLEEADYAFAIQLLTGDSTDTIKGVPRVGIKGAEKLLSFPLQESWREIVLKQYERAYPGEGEKMMVQNGQCLWMRRQPEQMWSLET